jgi:hypothetical protein
VKHLRKGRAHDEKRSARWLRGLRHGLALKQAGAAHVLVVAAREGDIYEDLAFCSDPGQAPDQAGVDLLVRVNQNRCLAAEDGGSGCGPDGGPGPAAGGKLFERAQALELSGEMRVKLAASSGRKARQAVLRYGFCPVEIARPGGRASARERAALPERVRMSLIVTREQNPPRGREPASWMLLTSQAVTSEAEAETMIRAYRQRWVIEQLFRTLKTQGFGVQGCQTGRAALEKLVTAAVIAAIQVMQLVQARDGRGKRPVSDAFAPGELPLLAALNESLQGATWKQKNPHPPDRLAWAAWIIARLGGWDGYDGKPGPIVMYNGLRNFRMTALGWNTRNV